MHDNLNAQEAIEKLIAGNAKYVKEGTHAADVSPAIREKTVTDGQHPYAVIVTCSDSRVIPEVIFSAGIGDLFVIRVAGNVIGKSEAGSIEYAIDHLGVNLVVVLGHEHCGAVAAAIEHSAHGDCPHGAVQSILDEIISAANGSSNPDEVCKLNVARSVMKAFSLITRPDVKTIGAIYHLTSGNVEFI